MARGGIPRGPRPHIRSTWPKGKGKTKAKDPPSTHRSNQEAEDAWQEITRQRNRLGQSRLSRSTAVKNRNRPIQATSMTMGSGTWRSCGVAQMHSGSASLQARAMFSPGQICKDSSGVLWAFRKQGFAPVPLERARFLLSKYMSGYFDLLPPDFPREPRTLEPPGRHKP